MGKKFIPVDLIPKSWIRRAEMKRYIGPLVSIFDRTFPDAPRGQGRAIMEGAYKYSKVIFVEDVSDYDKVVKVTRAFLRHQFWFPIHYGFDDVKIEANRQAYRIMEEWGYGRKSTKYTRRSKPVPCPSCLGEGCFLCVEKGIVPLWVAINYHRWIWRCN